MSRDLFRIVYCSRTTLEGDELPISRADSRGVSPQQCARRTYGRAARVWTEASRRCSKGEFDAVQQTFERIQADERHEEVILLQAHIAGARLFGGWTMGLASPDDPAAAHEILRAAVAESSGDSARKLVELLDSLVRREEWMTTPV